MEVISAWELYLWTRLDSINGFFTLASALLAVFLFFVVGKAAIDSDVYCYSSYEEGKRKYATAKATLKSMWIKLSFLFLIIMVFFSILIPSKKDAAMIWVIPKIANNQHIQQEASEIYTMAKQALREALGQEVKKVAEK